MNFKSKLSIGLTVILILVIGSFFILSNSISVFLLNHAQRNMYDLDLDAAQKYLNMAKLTNKNIDRYHFISGNIELLKKKNYEAALSHFTAALDAGFTPREVVLFKRATIYQFYLVNYERALADYLETEKGTITNLSTNPDGALIMLYQPLASVYIELGRAGEAAQSIERILDLPQTEDSQAQNYAILGRVYYTMADYGKAVDAYKKSLDLNPNQPLIATRYARALKHLGDINAAISEINKVLATNPDYKQALCALAGIYVEAKDYDRAIEAAEKALKDDKIGADNISCFYHSATAYYNKGDFSSAKSDLESLLDNFTKMSLTGPEYQGLKSSAEELLTKIASE